MKPIKIFLAGGISGCPDWQSLVIEKVNKLDLQQKLVLFNPRRPDFDRTFPGIAAEQITWEHERLMESDIVLFWFPCETLCPITLFELGKMAMTDKKIVVGCHSSYERRLDVKVQLELIFGYGGPIICSSLPDLVQELAEVVKTII